MIQNSLWCFHGFVVKSHQTERVLDHESDQSLAVKDKLVPGGVFVPDKRVQPSNLGGSW